MTKAHRNRDLRAVAITHVEALARRYGVLDWGQIEAGFPFRGKRIRLANRARGIFRPRQLTDGALSIKTTIPRGRRDRRYDDEIASDAPYFAYRYQGADPGSRDNIDLRACYNLGLPVIYWYGIDVARYQPIVCYVVGDLPDELTVHVAPVGAAYGADDPVVRVAAMPAETIERRYVIRQVRQRLHQSKFREAVLAAYDRRCTICRLRHRDLLDAAHIVPDRDVLGEARVPNGLAMCKLHHAAYDADVIGVTPDYQVRVRLDVLEENDGPILEHGLRGIDRQRIHPPARREDSPDPELLELRWSAFCAA